VNSLRFIKQGVCAALQNNVIFFIFHNQSTSPDDFSRFFPSSSERTIDFYSLYNGTCLLTVHVLDEVMSIRLWDI